MNSLNLKQIDGGNIIKQADSGSLFKFELLDENHKKFEEQLGDTATVILKKDTVAVFKKIVAVTDNCVAFNLDKILEVGDYILEIIVGEYVFPSNNRLKISVESTYGDYQPENLVRITYEEIDEKINKLKDRLNDLNVAGQTEMLMRIENLEAKEDKDTIYDDTPIIKRIEKLESKEDNDTIYDDSEIKRRITALEQKEDHDTIYDDTEIKQSIANVDNKMSGLSEKVTALEERPIVDTALTERVEALERKEDRDTVYDDSAIVKRIETLEQKEDKDTIYNDTEIKNRLVALEQKEDKDTVYDDSKLVERIENLESDDKTIKERISALEDKPDNDTIYDDSNLKAQITELQEKLKSLNTVRHAPTGYTLDRTTTPWTVWFDNGCGLQMPDYSPKDEQVQNSTIYGFGFSLNIMNTTVGTYPVPQNFIAASMGHISLNNFSKQDANAFIYFSPSTKVINPVRNDAENFDWSHCYGEVNEDNNAYKRKHVFPRICYELGIWSEEDVLYLGATKK